MGIKIKHVWFEEKLSSVDTKDCDIVFVHSLSGKYIPENFDSIVSQQYTLISDLTKEKEELFFGIKKNYRYEIKRCDRSDEKITYRYYDQKNHIDEMILNRFEDIYNQMYIDKGIKSVFNRKQIENMINSGSIVFSVGFYQDIPLVFHSYVYSQDDSKVRFYYSASPFRQEKEESERIGRINKGLHWFDFRTFKEQGIKIYDWGGIANPDNPDGIGKFKLSFGGQVVLLYNIITANSLKGKITIMLLKMRKK